MLTESPAGDEELFKRAFTDGNLAWQLESHQITFYEMVWKLIRRLHKQEVQKSDFRVGCVQACRKIGKTYVAMCIASEFAIQKPRMQILFVAETATQAEETCVPIMEQIFENCPPSLKPAYNAIKHCYTFPNGSRIQLKGGDMSADRLRGPSSDLIICDEAAHWNKLEWTVDAVLRPRTARTHGPLIMFSSRGLTPDNEFNRYVNRCEKVDQAVTVTVYEAGFTDDFIIAERSSMLPDVWAIEYECKDMRNQNSSVVPEWTVEAEKNAVYIGDYGPHTANWRRFTALDLGTSDNTVIIAGAYDAEKDMLHALAERTLTGADVTDGNVARLILDAEAEVDLVLQSKCPFDRVRVSDHDIAFLQSINANHDLRIIPVVKPGLEISVNALRMKVQADKLRLNKRCRNTLACLRRGEWQIRTGKQGASRRILARSSAKDEAGFALGHYDALMALVYLNQATVPWRTGRNPETPAPVYSYAGLDYSNLQTQARSQQSRYTGKYGVAWLPK